MFINGIFKRLNCDKALAEYRNRKKQKLSLDSKLAALLLTTLPDIRPNSRFI